MKTWRERLDAYRQSGTETDDDRQALGRVNPGHHPPGTSLCAIGEWMYDMSLDQRTDTRLWRLGDYFVDAWNTGDFARCDRLLDAIEDHALKLKRESTA